MVSLKLGIRAKAAAIGIATSMLLGHHPANAQISVVDGPQDIPTFNGDPRACAYGIPKWVRPVTDGEAQAQAASNSPIELTAEQMAQAERYSLSEKRLTGDEASWSVQAQAYARQGQQYFAEAAQLAALVNIQSTLKAIEAELAASRGSRGDGQ